ncbi:octopamine receptor beta-2R-like [Dendronephthya gigantea]|uniref:octopamine receptor beta-2R-like n=1 Tax=Dendronephthya gigantea TaxID=151771 RepID=UPI00106A14BE|nr:octopamine receptor beta-2R-like [Dendronephthya gigantea]
MSITVSYLFRVIFHVIIAVDTFTLLGNVTVIIYTVLLSKEKTATSYLIANLAFTDLLVCLTFYPLWIIEFIQILLNIDSDQELFCKLSRSTIWSLLVASVATLLAITVDRYLFIVKPLKYPLIVTRRRVFLAISGIWLTTCCLYTIFHVQYKRFDNRIKRFPLQVMWMALKSTSKKIPSYTFLFYTIYIFGTSVINPFVYGALDKTIFSFFKQCRKMQVPLPSLGERRQKTEVYETHINLDSRQRHEHAVI